MDVMIVTIYSKEIVTNVTCKMDQFLGRTNITIVAIWNHDLAFIRDNIERE